MTYGVAWYNFINIYEAVNKTQIKYKLFALSSISTKSNEKTRGSDENGSNVLTRKFIRLTVSMKAKRK